MSKLTTWVDVAPNSDFSIYNLPFGIFSTKDKSPRVGSAIGDYIVDLVVLCENKLIEIPVEVVSQGSLNAFIGLGKTITSSVRLKIQQLLIDENSPLKSLPEVLIKQSGATMHLPVEIGDYTDFYSSIEHATNIGKMFRDPKNALLPNWKHLPVGYHGRSSTIVPSGVDIYRPKGQVLPKGSQTPVFQYSSRLDFELEMAFIIGKQTQMGETITTQAAEEHIFGLVLFNDWSARDIQKWEYVPLGPFLGKNFASSISPWVVTLEALENFKTAGPKQDPKPLSYLEVSADRNYDINLEVYLAPEKIERQLICRSNFKYMYWNMSQQLAHHTVNGCRVCVGDLMASGTLSGKTEDSFGSMIELSWAGTKPLTMKDGSKRTFINDYDTVIMSAFAEKNGKRVGFGQVKSKVLPGRQ